MLGSISKIRPAGHHHYYKYAHATSMEDALRIDANYKEDRTDDYKDLWDYPFYNLTKADTSSDALFWDKNTATKFNFYAPKLKVTGYHTFRNDTLERGVKELSFYAPDVTNMAGMLYMAQRMEKFTMIPPTGQFVTHLSYFAEGTRNLKDWTKHDFSNVTNISYAWKASRGDGSGKKFECDFSKVEYANNAFGVTGMTEMKYPIDEDGNWTFKSKKPQLIIDGVPQYKYNEFPKLKQGSYMFSGTTFYKPTTFSIIKSLPTWNDGKSNHVLNIGIHIDLKYDQEMNTELKKIDKDYITPLENVGYGLSTEITSDKGWSLIPSWNGTATGEEVIEPDLLDKMEFDTIILPDGYTRCIYLEDTDNQYIDTGYVPTNTTGLWGLAKQITHTEGYPIGCGFWSLSNSFYLPRTCKNKNNTSGYGWKGGISYSASTTGGIVFEGYLNYKNDRTAKLKYDNSDIKVNTLGDLGFTPSLSLYLAGTNKGNSSQSVNWLGRIYRIQITEESEIIRDFIPCLDADGKPCMRDVINGVDYYNQGTGADFDYEIYKSE